MRIPMFKVDHKFVCPKCGYSTKNHKEFLRIKNWQIGDFCPECDFEGKEDHSTVSSFLTQKEMI
jgi:rubredoxin